MTILFHTERTDINSASIASMIKEYERIENGDIFSHESYDEVYHFEVSKLKHMDISSFKLKGQKIQMQ